MNNGNYLRTTQTPPALTGAAGEFDYRHLLERQDPDVRHHEPAQPTQLTAERPRWQAPTDLGGLQDLHDLLIDNVLPALLDPLHDCDVTARAAEVMHSVQRHLADLASRQGIDSFLDERLPELVADFIASPDDLDARRLRRSAVHCIELTLDGMGLLADPLNLTKLADVRLPAPAPGRPVPRRLSTHDEVITLRLAAPLTSSSQHLGAEAVLAVLTSSATTHEGELLTVQDALPLQGRLRLSLPGFQAKPGGGNKSIAPRRVTCDQWQHDVLMGVLQHAADNDDDDGVPAGRAVGDAVPHGRARSGQPATAVAVQAAPNYLLCKNNRRAPSQSAQIALNKMFNDITVTAGLHNEPGLTPTSLRRWAAARDVHDLASACAAADRIGLPIMRLHAEITGGRR